MINRVGKRRGMPLERRTTAELQAIAHALRCRIAADMDNTTELSREIARIERLIASRRSPSNQPNGRDAAP
jgi:hypothetical protein